MARVQVWALTFCTVLTCQGLPARAGPDDTTSRLMNEYVSLLDFGILRLQLELDRQTRIPKSNVWFNWEDNVIEIYSQSYERSWSKEQVEQACTDWFKAIRGIAGVDAETGKLLDFITTSTFSDLFRHYGFSKTLSGEGIAKSGKSTDEVTAELDSKFRLEFSWQSVSLDLEPGDARLIVCSGPLLDTGYSVKVESVGSAENNP